VTYFHFLYDMFAGVKTREKLAPKSKIIIGVLVVANIIWGSLGFDWVHTSDTCKDDGNAVNTYRLSYLLSLVFLVFLLLLCLFLLAALMDFLCSGRMRFVIVIATGDEDEEEDP